MKKWTRDSLHCTKMGADSLAENNPNAPEFICPICLPKTKSSEFQKKVRVRAQLNFIFKLVIFMDLGARPVVRRLGTLD